MSYNNVITSQHFTTKQDDNQTINNTVRTCDPYGSRTYDPYGSRTCDPYGSSNYVLLGGNGYYGYNFIKYLTQQPRQDSLSPSGFTPVNIVVVDKNINDIENLKDYPELTFLKCDLAFHTTQDGKIFYTMDIINNINERLVKGPVYLINFAAESFVDTSLKKPMLTTQNNIYEAITFCKIASYYKQIEGSKIIHISTDEVFNKFEKVIYNRSAYSVSKDVIEDIVLNLVPETIILRPSNLFGCIDYTDVNSIQRKPCVIKNLVNGIYNVHNVNVSRRFVHIVEACQTLEALCKNKACSNLTRVNIDMDYNNRIFIYVFNDDTEINISDLIKYVAKKDSAEVITQQEDPRDDKQDYDYNTFYEIQDLKIKERRKNNNKKISLEDVYEEIKRMRTVLNDYNEKPVIEL